MAQAATLAAFTKGFKDPFEDGLREHLRAATNRVKDLHPAGEELAEVIGEFSVRGGKRLRPLLVALGYEAYSRSNDWREVLNAAISVELFHAFFLIHDDIMDRSDLRRGLPTVHRIFEKRFIDQGLVQRDSLVHLSSSMAILAGDQCCQIAYDALHMLDMPENRILRALRHMRQMVEATLIGQVLDMVGFFEQANEELVTNIQILKTARYSVEAPLHLGMILADAGPSDLEAISRFAIPAGIAYQITDDLLGMFGSEKEVGKPVTSDLAEGKETLLTVIFRSRAPRQAQKQFAELHGKSEITVKELSDARSLLRAYGAVEYSESRARALVDEAKDSLARTQLPAVSRNMLAELAESFIGRTT